MFELLFSNIGKKIKGLAIGTFVVEAIGAIITGIILIATDDDYLLYGLISIFWGPIVALFLSWLLYGFGELIDKTCKIERNTIDIEYNTRKNAINKNAEEAFDRRSMESRMNLSVSSNDSDQAQAEQQVFKKPPLAEEQSTAALIRMRAKGLITEQEYLEALQKKNGNK